MRIQTRFNTGFRAIGLPHGDAAAREIVQGLDEGVVLARGVGRAFARRSLNSLGPALQRYLEFTLALNRRVRSYGFRVCGRT